MSTDFSQTVQVGIPAGHIYEQLLKLLGVKKPEDLNDKAQAVLTLLMAAVIANDTAGELYCLLNGIEAPKQPADDDQQAIVAGRRLFTGKNGTQEVVDVLQVEGSSHYIRFNSGATVWVEAEKLSPLTDTEENQQQSDWYEADAPVWYLHPLRGPISAVIHHVHRDGGASIRITDTTGITYENASRDKLWPREEPTATPGKYDWIEPGVLAWDIALGNSGLPRSFKVVVVNRDHEDDNNPFVLVRRDEGVLKNSNLEYWLQGNDLRPRAVEQAAAEPTQPEPEDGLAVGNVVICSSPVTPYTTGTIGACTITKINRGSVFPVEVEFRLPGGDRITRQWVPANSCRRPEHGKLAPTVYQATRLDPGVSAPQTLKTLDEIAAEEGWPFKPGEQVICHEPIAYMLGSRKILKDERIEQAVVNVCQHVGDRWRVLLEYQDSGNTANQWTDADRCHRPKQQHSPEAGPVPKPAAQELREGEEAYCTAPMPLYNVTIDIGWCRVLSCNDEVCEIMIKHPNHGEVKHRVARSTLK